MDYLTVRGMSDQQLANTRKELYDEKARLKTSLRYSTGADRQEDTDDLAQCLHNLSIIEAEYRSRNPERLQP